MTLALPMPLLPTDGDYQYGREYNWASWDPNTELLLTSVPINSDYRDIVQMDSQADWDAWLESKPNWTYTNSTLQKFNDGIVAIDLDVNEAMKYNYLRAKNGINPAFSTQRTYYYFITGLRYGAPNTTYLSIQLDVISTFLYETKLGQCYVEQGHIGIANTHAFDAYGRDYLTIPEGHDIGSEYNIVHVEQEQIMDTLAESANTSIDQGYDILVVSTLDLTQDPGTATNPHQNSARGSVFQDIPAGAEFYIFPTANDLMQFFEAYSDKPWITQSIISITIIPNLKRYYPNYDYGTDLSSLPLVTFYKAGSTGPSSRLNHMMTNWRNSQFIQNILGIEYQYLKKFLTFPYMVIELTTFTGSPLMIKPEAWQDADATIREQIALLPPAQRVAFMPVRYNADPETLNADQPASTLGVDDFGEYLDFATYLDNFVQVPVVNNSYMEFLAQNAHGIPFSYQSAQWTEQRALRGAGAAYDVQNAQIANMGRQSGIANTAQSSTAGLMATTSINNAALGIGTGGLRGTAGDMAEGADPLAAVAGGALGAASGMMQAGNSAQAGLQAAQNSVSARGESAVSDIQTAGSVRDTNNAFATMAAKGDYKNAVAGIQARVQDAKMLQPSTSGQFNGDAFNLINGMVGYSLRFKMINKAAMRQIGNFWLRYGYAIGQFMQMPDSLHCMSNFTYWKVQEAYISQGAFPEGFKQIIRGIFEKGVTVWKDPSKIGTTQLWDNAPLEGISY